jgi:hypothetical protein
MTTHRGRKGQLVEKRQEDRPAHAQRGPACRACKSLGPTTAVFGSRRLDDNLSLPPCRGPPFMRRSSEGGGRGVGVRLAACLRGKVRVLAHQFDRDPPKQVRSSSSSPVRRASLPFFAQQTMGAHSVESSATLRRSCPVHARAPRRRPPTGVSESVLRGRRCHRQPLGPATSLPLFSTSAETKAKARKGGVPLLPGETLIPAQRRLLARARDGVC